MIPRELFETIDDLCRVHGVKKVKTTVMSFFELLESHYDKKENKMKYVPLKEGKWIWKKFDENTGITNHYFCSECNYPKSQIALNYCANCGAKMEKM